MDRMSLRDGRPFHRRLGFGRELMMRTCIAASSLSGSLAERINAAADAGFDGLELDADELHAAGMPPAEYASRCADHGLVTELFHLPSLALGGPATHTGLEALTLLDRGFATMDQLGATTVAIGAPPCRDGDPVLDEDSRAQVSALFIAGMTAMAACHGIDCVLEARPGTQIADVVQAWRVIEDLEDPELTLTLDLCDLLVHGEPALDVADLPAGFVGLVRVSDATPAEAVASDQPGRLLPGEGQLRLVEQVAMMLSLGFDGAISVNGCGRGSPSAYDDARCAARTLHALLEQADDLAEHATPVARVMR